MAVTFMSGGFASPDSIANITGWWSADQGVYTDAGVTLATNGQTVQQWNDRLAGGFHMSQGTAGNRPTYVTNVQNGLPVVRFGGATDDDFLQSTGNISSLFGVNAKTVFAVSKWTANSDSSILGSVAETVFMQHTSAGAAISFYNFDGTFDGASEPATIGAWQICTGWHDGVNVMSGVNDTRTASMTSAASGNTTSLATNFYFGRRGVTAQYLDGDIGEVITFTVPLSEDSRKVVEQWLAYKWNITLPY